MAIFGMLPIKSGSIYIKQRKVNIHSSDQAVKHGIAIVSEDRKKYGLNFVWDIRKNITISNLKAISTASIVSDKKIDKRAKHFFDNLRIKAPRIQTKVATLSGGNQQKVVIARSLNCDPNIIILDEPTKELTLAPKTKSITLSTTWQRQEWL